MRLIFCIDDKGGMMFFGKRQSKDSVLRNWIVNYAQGAKLWMSLYSAKQFDGNPGIFVDNDYILSNSQEDIEKCKKAFFKWKDITQQWHHLIFSDFWCIMLLCQIKEMRFFSGQFNVSGYTLHQKLHQHTHYRILDTTLFVWFYSCKMPVNAW